jgi:sporulation-control protein
VPQDLGFYQEIEFFPPPHLADRLDQVELTFVAGPRDLWVVLEADKRGGVFRQGGDTFGRFHLSHEEAERTDWTTIIGDWLAQAADRAPQPNPAFGPHAHHHDHGYDNHHGHHARRGPGMGAVLGGAAAGLAGGMLLGDLMDGELFDGPEEPAEEE